MCQSIVGTEDNVKQIRLMNAVRDDLSIHKNEISITSGSYGEGLDMRGSDLDIMYVVRHIKVYDVKPRLNPNSAYLLMDTDNVKPGFTQLRLDSKCTSYYNCVQLADKYYLSSSLWKKDILTKNLDYTIHGPCVSDKDGLYDYAECLHYQVSSFSASMQYFNMERNLLYINDVEKTTSSTLLQLANNSFRGVFKILHSSSFIRGIQKTDSCEKSSIKYVYTYYMSMMSAVRAQSIPLNSAYSNNKYQYRQYKSCLCTLLKNIHHDAVSEWLMLASFFYKTKQYTRAVRIIMDCISKCTFEKLYPYIKMSDIHHRLFKLKSLQKKSIVHLWKYVLVDDIRFEVNSLLIPDELLIEVDYYPLRIPSSVYACFLCFLCHYHLNDARQCRDTLQGLQLVIECNYLNADLDAKAAAYNLLGVALQTVGETETARQAYLQSAELHIDPTDNPARKRVFLLE
ncbi:unnamed protein product [Mytilus coruscus]|uniref:Uncharacterized protein n=1 Tax=Mytilus coruscus TaxID=42192 RepID=A0A6J8EQC7_MYTCO|nr:unnamed protein product [Mytilus coruscus]